jgi:hypothetical protein
MQFLITHSFLFSVLKNELKIFAINTFLLSLEAIICNHDS